MSPRKQPSHAVLDEVRYFISKVAWAPGEHLDVMTLSLAVTHSLDAFEAVGHVLLTGEMGAGKTVLGAGVPMLLANNPWQVGKNTTDWALQTKFGERGGNPTLVCDDVSKIFGNSGLNGHTSRVYDVLVKCYTRLGVVSMQVNRVATDVPTFTPAFLNGLHEAVPKDLGDRCVILPMVKKPARIQLHNVLSPAIRSEGLELREVLHGWAGANVKVMREFMRGGVLHVHPELSNRLLDKWGPLFAVAHAAGGQWPQRCLDAFLKLALDASEKPAVFGYQRALMDTAKVIIDTGMSPVIYTADLVRTLRDLPDDRYAKMDDRYLVEELLPRALGPAREVRGRNMAGTVGRWWGRDVVPILEAAADLKEELYPPAAVRGTSQAQREMAMEVTG